MAKLVDPVEDQGVITSDFVALNPTRFQQKLNWIRDGRPVPALIGGRKGTMTRLLPDGRITIVLKDG